MSTDPYRKAADVPVEELLSPLPKPWWTVGRVSVVLIALAWVMGCAGFVIHDWPLTRHSIGGLFVMHAVILFVSAVAYWTYPGHR